MTFPPGSPQHRSARRFAVWEAVRTSFSRVDNYTLGEWRWHEVVVGSERVAIFPAEDAKELVRRVTTDPPPIDHDALKKLHQRFCPLCGCPFTDLHYQGNLKTLGWDLLAACKAGHVWILNESSLDQEGNHNDC